MSGLDLALWLAAAFFVGMLADNALVNAAVRKARRERSRQAAMVQHPAGGRQIGGMR